MKILAFIEATVVNGAAKSLLNLCEAGRHYEEGRNLQFELATFERVRSFSSSKRVEDNEFVQAVQRMGLPLHVIEERSPFDIKAIQKIRALVKKIDPDVVQTNNVKSHFLLRMSGVVRTRPTMAVHHGYTTTDWKMRAYNQLDRYSLRAFDGVVTVCKPFRQALIARGVSADRVVVVHNSIGPPENGASEQETALRQALGLAPDAGIILSVGRFSQEKGHADLLEAFALFQAKLTSRPWKLLLVGSGPEQDRLQALTKQLSLAGHVIFAGQQRDVAPFYRLAHLFVLPSHSEGSPHVLLEAMQARVPIVSTSVGGVPEMLTGPNSAFLVPPHDSQALFEVMVQAIESDEAHMRTILDSNSRQVSTRFSHEAYLRAMLPIYEAVRSTPVGS